MAGWMAIAGSFFLIVALFDAMASSTSIATREAFERMLSEQPARGLGVSVDSLVGLLRATILVTGAAATLTGILGWWVLQGDRVARAVCTAGAVVIALGAPFATGLWGMFVAFAAGLLWTAPARDWFAGRTVRRPEGAAASAPDARPPAEDVRPRASAEPPAPRPAAPPFGPPPMPGPRPMSASGWPIEGAPARPRNLVVACVVTWVFSAIAAFGQALVLLVLAAAREPFAAELERQPRFDELGIDVDQAVTVLGVSSAVGLVWSLVAISLAAAVWARRAWAQPLLLASASVSLMLSLLAFPAGVVHAVASAVVIWRLLRPDVRAWLARR